LHVDHTTIYRSRATLRTRTGETLPTPRQNHEQLVVRGWDVHQSEKGVKGNILSQVMFIASLFGVAS
jgi:hypothetical protein